MFRWCSENMEMWPCADEKPVIGSSAEQMSRIIPSSRPLMCFRVHPVGPEEPQKEAGFKQTEGAVHRGAPPTRMHAADSGRPADRLQPQSLQSCRQLPLQGRRLQSLQEQGTPNCPLCEARSLDLGFLIMLFSVWFMARSCLGLKQTLSQHQPHV